MNVQPTSMEWEYPLKCKINCLLVDPVSLSSFFNTFISLRKLLQVKPNLIYVLWGLGLANSGQTCVEEVMLRFLGFGYRMQERPTISPQGAVASFDSLHQPAETITINWTQERLSSISCVLRLTLLETRWHPKRRNLALLPLRVLLDQWP